MASHNFDIPFQYIKDAYERQAWIHEQLRQAYEQAGLVDEDGRQIIYGGRSRYATLQQGTKISENSYYGKYQKVGSSYQIGGVDKLIGYGGVYRKLDARTKEIHRQVLRNITNSIHVSTNKYLLDKFASFNFGSGGKDIFKKLVKVTAELITYLDETKSWVKEVDKTIRDAERKYTKAIRENAEINNLISMNKLEDIGRAILGRSTELCPYETGFLRSSGTIYVYDDYIRIIYECPYAMYVHENINAEHPFGQAKFLETAAQEVLQSKSVWVEAGQVEGTVMQLYWEHNQYGVTKGDAVAFTQRAGYNTVQITIDRNLRINTRS